MSDDPDREFGDRIREEEKRRLKHRSRRERSWFGLGMFGLVGWAFALPMLGILAVGIWLDTRSVGGYSWSLMAVFVGAALGAFNAWFWVQAEQRKIEEEDDDD